MVVLKGRCVNRQIKKVSSWQLWDIVKKKQAIKQIRTESHNTRDTQYYTTNYLHYNCERFYRHQFIPEGRVALTRHVNSQTDDWIECRSVWVLYTPKNFICWGIIRQKVSWCKNKILYTLFYGLLRQIDRRVTVCTFRQRSDR